MEQSLTTIKMRAVGNDDAWLAEAGTIITHEYHDAPPVRSFFAVPWDGGISYAKTFEGTSKRDPDDESDNAVGHDLAMLRALRSLVGALEAHLGAPDVRAVNRILAETNVWWSQRLSRYKVGVERAIDELMGEEPKEGDYVVMERPADALARPYLFRLDKRDTWGWQAVWVCDGGRCHIGNDAHIRVVDLDGRVPRAVEALEKLIYV